MPPMRELPREEIEEGLAAGKTLCIVRRDDPNLPFINELVAAGKALMKVEQLDEQSSVLKVRRKD